MNELSRAWRMERRFFERLSTGRQTFPFGTAFFDEEYRDRYVSNFLCADRNLGRASAKDLARSADDILGGAGYPHRMLVVHSDADGGRMAPGFIERGYRLDPTAIMVLRRDPDHGPNVDVEERPFSGARPVIHETYRRDKTLVESDVVARFTDQHGKYERALGVRFFVGLIEGEPAGVCELWRDGTDAMVEHVDTLAEFRGRGVARSVTLRAIAEARAGGAEHVFIFADDDDWPKELYRRLGFDRIGREWEFIKSPDATEGS
jgi:ribosomal protein S18 acetylase RimI-like enzyme